MGNTRVFFLLLPVLIPSVCGCATYSAAPRTYRPPRTVLEVSLPAGWLRHAPSNPMLVMTRDGLRLETITILTQKVGKKIEGTERTFSPEMLPTEIAEVWLGLKEAQDATRNFSVNSVELQQVAGVDGYTADANYVDVTGTPMRMRQSGVLLDQQVILFEFVGAEPVYFEKYVSDFERMVGSARLTKG